MTTARTLSRAKITEMVQRIDPTWTVASASRATDGAHVVYHLTVETDAGRGSVVLKATPPDTDPVCDEEARLLAILGEHTSLPLPHVLGVVDESRLDAVPTPYFVATEVEGANPSRTDLGSFSTADVEAVARSSGRLLAALHGLDAVDGYGFVDVDVDVDEPLDGGRPATDLDTLQVHDPITHWSEYLHAEVDRVVPALDDSRFADLAPPLRRTLHERIDALDDAPDPVLARIDQSLDNVVLDPETGAVTGLLDWEFCVAATPAYDLAFVEHTLAGGHWVFLPDAPDVRERIRDALLEGYANANADAESDAVDSDRAVRRFDRDRSCYALLVRLHAMTTFDSWFDQLEGEDVTADSRERAADRLRGEVQSLIDGDAD